MDITSLPTESLHKFLALAGLIMVTIGPTYFYRLYYQIAQKEIDAETEYEILEYQTKHLDRVSDVFNDDNEINNALIASKLKGKHEVSETDIAHAIDIFRANSKAAIEIREKFLAIRVAIAKSKNTSKTIDLLHRQKRGVVVFGCLLVFSGILMSYIGFRKWYEVQVYIDEGIKKEATNK